MKKFTFSGNISQGRGTQPFERTVEGESVDHARDLLFSQLCSEHSVKRTKISIESEEDA